MTLPLELDDDALELQRDELEAISAMFGDDVTILSESYPISYSIKLRPANEEVEDASIWPRDVNLALSILYPANYPDEAAIFGLSYSDVNLKLHSIQENAALNHINTVAESELGTPCILNCYYAARDFINNLGLIQAALAILSDDCLASVLSYLAASKEDVDIAVAALPLFAGVYRTDIVWKQICCTSWKQKWGFTRRWKKACNGFQQHLKHNGISSSTNTRQLHFFWFKRYKYEECDSKRRAITRDELCQCPFEQRRWFGHNDQLNVRSAPDVLPTGLSTPGLDCRFTFYGKFLGYSRDEVEYSFDGANPNIVLLSSVTGSRDFLTIRRTPDWGWQLSNNDFVFRSKDEPGDKFASSESLWKDLSSNIVMQERPPGVVSRFNWREIPDDEELQFLLPWRNSWRAPVRQN